MQTGMWSHGRNRALESGAVEPRPEHIAALTENARAMARQTYRDKFDPSRNAHDALHEAEFQRLLAHRTDAEQAERHAGANLRDAENKQAATHKAGPKPHAHPLSIVAFTVAITITVAPTLHDLVVINDDLLAWFVATLSSALVGFMVTWAILEGRRSTWEWVGVAAGVILGVGLCAVRLSATSDGGDKGTAVGLTIVEIATIFFIELVARALRRNDSEWFPRYAAEMQAVAECDAAWADLSRRQAKVKELHDAIAAKIDMIENRHNRNIRLQELEAVAIKAVLDGYNSGIAENIGRLQSVRVAAWRRTS